MVVVIAIAAVILGVILWKVLSNSGDAQDNLSARDYWRWKSGGID